MMIAEQSVAGAGQSGAKLRDGGTGEGGGGAGARAGGDEGDDNGGKLMTTREARGRATTPG